MVGHMPGMILVLDSHGTRSGYNGFLYVPYTVFSDPDAMVEMQAIVDVCAPSENVKPGEKATMGSGRLCVDKCPAYLPISVNQTSDGSFDPDLTHVCQTVSTSAHRGLQ
jgi:hypothetical protein